MADEHDPGAPSKDAATASGLQSRAIRGTWWTLANIGVSLPLGIVVNLIVAQALGVENYGQLAVLSIVVVLVSQLTDLGIGDTTVQYASAAQARGEELAADRILGTGLGFRLMVQIPALAVAIAFVLRDEPSWVLAIAAVGLLAPPLFGGASQALTIENRTHIAAAYGLASSVLSNVLAVVAAVSFATAATVWSARTLAGAAVIPAILWALSPRRRRAVLRPRLPWRTPPGWWTFALRMWVTTLLGTIVLNRTEVLVLERWSTPTQVGIFALAAGLAAQAAGPLAALVGPLIPAAAGLVAAAPERVVEAFARVLRVSSVLAGLLLASAVPAVVALVAPLYGADFADAAVPAGVMLAATTAAVIAAPAQAFLRARLRTDVLLRWIAVTAVVDVGLALALVPTLAAWGAIIAFVVSALLLASALVVAELSAEGAPIGASSRSVLPWLLGAVVAGAAVAATRSLESSLLQALLSTAASLVAYVLCVRAFGVGVSPRDAEVAISGLPGRLQPMVARFLALVVTKTA